MSDQLNAEEREIRERFERGELRRAAGSEAEIEVARHAARETFRKTRRVNLRVTTHSARRLSALFRRWAWPATRIATPVALIVIPFGYAITGNHHDVWTGVGCGVAIGIGVGLRGGSRRGPWTGVLVGSIVGVVTALIVGGSPLRGWMWLLPPVFALAVGLIDGLGHVAFTGYRDVVRETFIVSGLVFLGFLPASTSVIPVETVFLAPWIALLVGLLCHRLKGWHDARAPRLLVLGAAAVFVLTVLGLAAEMEGAPNRLRYMAWMVPLTMIATPVAAFVVGRTAIIWLGPRLRVYGQLADYLRIMWVPIGGFAVGYLTIIVFFAGFYGMLERLSPGAFSVAGTGIADWLYFSFFNALGQDYNTIAPVSFAARTLVGVHLILSVGWALVLFAAVMSSIQPKLDRIARRHAEDGGG